ncbi:MAG: hypothetical protein HC874_14340 [Richelia sp. SL_2_1]|nr:hypothetical protein [Richelia sp. SL_2_1]
MDAQTPSLFVSTTEAHVYDYENGHVLLSWNKTEIHLEDYGTHFELIIVGIAPCVSVSEVFEAIQDLPSSVKLENKGDTVGIISPIIKYDDLSKLIGKLIVKNLREKF